MANHHIFMPDKTLAGVITLSRQEESVLTSLRLSQRGLTATAFIAIKIAMEREKKNPTTDPVLGARNLFFGLRNIPVQWLDEPAANAGFLLQIGILTQIGLLAVQSKPTTPKGKTGAEFAFPLSTLDVPAPKLPDVKPKATSMGVAV
jgi:hypothetical protein